MRLSIIGTTGTWLAAMAAALPAFPAWAQQPAQVPVPFTQCITSEADYKAEVRWFDANDKRRPLIRNRIKKGERSCNSGLSPAEAPRHVRVTVHDLLSEKYVVYEGVPKAIVIYGSLFVPQWREEF